MEGRVGAHAHARTHTEWKGRERLSMYARSARKLTQSGGRGEGECQCARTQHTRTHTHTPNVEWRGRVSSHARSARRVEGESQCVRILIVVHEERGVGGRVGVYSRTHADWKGRVRVGPHVRHV